MFIVSLISSSVLAQKDPIVNMGNRIKNIGGQMKGGSSTDSLRHRTKLEDSITISFRYLDSIRAYKLDSSIGDFTTRFPIPANYIYLGNTGNAARSLLFSPMLSAGFDPGFHAFDVYKWRLEKVRFFNTTRPYSEINYLLGSRVEQVIEIMHTQNVKPNWNIAFQYRLINSPGFFQNQGTNHNNYLFASKFQSKNLRYNNYLVLLGSKIQSWQNGGIVDTTDPSILDNPIYKDRFGINTHIGGANPFPGNFFASKISTGNQYSEFTAMLRQQYDLGKKDSIVSDSTVTPLFYPRLRFEHTIQVDKGNYLFFDYKADSAYYKNYYDTTLRRTPDSVILRDRWQIFTNDFSVYQFPDAKNLQQFIKLGASIQTIIGEFSSGKKTFFNSWGHAEYRNRTRNLQWEIQANGKLFFTGFNAGDFEAHISLQRLLGKKLGYLQLGFENASRTPSFNFDNRSSYYFLKTVTNFKKENNTHLYASYFLPSFKLRLTGHYYLLTNYTYVSNYFRLQQESTLFNMLQLALQKTIKLGKHWNWHAEVYFQQALGDAPVHVPPVYTRNRFAYEGNLGFKNLDIAMGLEAKYRAPYKADNYSAVLGQFSYQDTVTVKNDLPDISVYVHFRIRPFKAFIRAENLNTGRKLTGAGFGFTNNNLVAPDYPMPGLQIRVGIWWGFVN